jgi:hypothetical protein
MDQPPKQYQIPTHLKTPDFLPIGSYQLTMRQFVIAVVAFLAIDQVWYYITLWHWPLLLRQIVCGALALLAFIVATTQVGGMGLERWLWAVWVPYLMQPKRYLWRRLPPSQAREDTPM